MSCTSNLIEFLNRESPEMGEKSFQSADAAAASGGLTACCDQEGRCFYAETTVKAVADTPSDRQLRPPMASEGWSGRERPRESEPSSGIPRLLQAPASPTAHALLLHCKTFCSKQHLYPPDYSFKSPNTWPSESSVTPHECPILNSIPDEDM